jgi:hypothetical protein
MIAQASDRYGYQLTSGRWSSFNLRKKKRKGKAKSTTPVRPAPVVRPLSDKADSDDEMADVEASDEDADAADEMQDIVVRPPVPLPAPPETTVTTEEDDGPMAPRERYNAMLAVQRNILCALSI